MLSGIAMRFLMVSALCFYNGLAVKRADLHDEVDNRILWQHKKKKHLMGQLPRGDWLGHFQTVGETSATLSPTDESNVVPPVATPFPTGSPTKVPTPTPTPAPTTGPTALPTVPPTSSPTRRPTDLPTSNPTQAPTASPVETPTTLAPTLSPTTNPTPQPTPSPTASPVETPTTLAPTLSPTTNPTPLPTPQPTLSPTASPVETPTTLAPTLSPTTNPTPQPTPSPTASPVVTPTTGSSCENADITDRVILEIADDGITDVDQSGSGFTSGDIFVFDNIVTVIGSGLTGTVFGRCVVLESLLTDGNTYCAMHFDLPDGHISLQGIFFDMTIVAGSGCYLGIEGRVLGLTNQTGIYYAFEVDDTANPPDECPSALLAAWDEEGGDTTIDADRNGLSNAGDYVVFDGNILRAGEFMGMTLGECVLLPTLSDDNTYCQISFEFEQGSLLVQGEFAAMVIVGGTGCFQGIQGTIVPQRLPDQIFRYTPSFTEDLPVACTENIFDMVWRESGGSAFFSDYDLNGRPSQGDLFIFDSATITVGDNVLSGTSAGKCQFLPSFTGNDEDVYCLYTFTFDEGILALQGLYTDMKIVGGSGCFINTSGRASVNIVGDPETGEDVFEYSFEIY